MDLGFYQGVVSGAFYSLFVHIYIYKYIYYTYTYIYIHIYIYVCDARVLACEVI